MILLVLPLTLYGWKMESGTVNLPATTAGSTQWQTITLQQTYDSTPLIFVLIDEGSGYNGDEPVALRIDTVTTGSFDLVQVEAQSSTGDVEGEHAAVNVHYIAIESGEHTFSDGTKIIAASHTTSATVGRNDGIADVWDSINFSSSFSATPVILTGIQSLNNETAALPGAASTPWMTVASRNSSSTGFEVSLDRAETSTGTVSMSEEIGYLAIDAGVQSNVSDTSCTSLLYETIRTSDTVRGWENQCTTFNFSNAYTNAPNVIGSQASRDGGDGGWLRRCSVSNTAVGIAVDEDQAGDSERRHTTEIAGLLVFENDFVYDSTLETVSCGLALDLYMDECYWTGGANGITGDVEDYSGNDLHATSRNRATNAELQFQVCRSGYFENSYSDQNQSDAVYYPDGTTEVLAIAKNEPFTVSLWLYREAGTKWMAATIKVSDDGWTDGWGIVHTNNGGDTIDFFVGDYTTTAQASVSTDTWTHIVGTYDGSTIRIYKNGVLADTQAQASYSPGALAISIGDDISGSAIDDRWQGYLDEVKVWHRTLSASEIQTIYSNENSALNYDGSARVCEPCNGTDVTADTWELIGIPAESRNVNLSVSDVFSDDLNGTYGTDWILYKRTFSNTDNSSGYAVLGLNEQLEFGKGYWLGSKFNGRWDVANTTSVDYNSTNTNCPTTACVEIDLRSVTLDGAVDNLLGSGPYRYNMNGFTGISQPVDWADCRFIVSDLDGNNEQVLTPSATDAAGYASKQIWLYNPSNIDANSNGYTVCDDTSPGGCKLLPFHGFWVELHGSTKNKIVKLLIPQE